MKCIFDTALGRWLDARTGLRGLIQAALYEHIPGGARWRYVWGSTLVFAFVVQMITGFFLWMAYSPSSLTAWESVHYIQHELAGGWLLRGIHHYTAQVMMVLIALHVLQVVIDGAYRAPREFNFWTGVVLLQIVLGLGLTGYLLPWDQKGYWATKVATNIAGLTPVIGDEVQRLAVGGAEYGHQTLTRFFALHTGFLPLAMIAFIGLHVYFFRRQGIHTPPSAATRRDAYFWPDQVLRDAVACLGVLAVVLVLVFWQRIIGNADAHLGAELMAPAEPSDPYSAARPDWYFLFLYQFLKYFPEDKEVWGAIYVPAGVMGLVALMPLIGRWKLGHRFNVTLMFALLLGAVGLTGVALWEDSKNEGYRHALADARRAADRINQLASRPTGIPPSGAAGMLRDDPLTQGPRIFRQRCAPCHRFGGHDGHGRPVEEKQSAADLEGFASRDWLRGLLDPERIATEHYFGGTEFAEGTMADFVRDDVAEYTDEEKEKLQKVIIALSAEASLRAQRDADAADVETILEGRLLMAKDSGDEEGLNCLRCHTFHGEGKQRGPDLTGYGSREWLIGIVSDPTHERFYGKRNDRMPSFGAKEILDARSIGLVVDWLRGEWYVPGQPWPIEVAAVVPPPQRSSASAAQDTPAVAADDNATDAAGDAASATPSGAAAPAGAPVDFAAEVKPILEMHCVECHGRHLRRPKSDYRLDRKETAFTPGEYGEPPLVPGKRAESLVFQLVSSDDEDERMPPEGDAPPLTAAQIETIGRWIDAGAVWPDGLELAVPEKDE